MASFPAVFLSHGAPTLLMDETPAREFLAGLGDRLGRPRAVVVASAHWETARPTLTGSAAPTTIHDFFGFPEALYRERYPAPGDPALAARTAELLAGAGLESGVDPERGLDHGAWVPLRLMYPDAGVPVVQVSLQPALGTAHHLRLGRALAPLREEGVLVVGSGGATHNLREFRGHALDDPPPDWVAVFDDWLEDAVTGADTGALVAYREHAPEAARNHPTIEHYVPLLVAAGAGGGAGRRLHRGFTFGVLSMAAYAFGGDAGH